MPNKAINHENELVSDALIEAQASVDELNRNKRYEIDRMEADAADLMEQADYLRMAQGLPSNKRPSYAVPKSPSVYARPNPIEALAERASRTPMAQQAAAYAKLQKRIAQLEGQLWRVRAEADVWFAELSENQQRYQRNR